MRLAMIQMSNSGSVEKNMEKSLHAIAEAAENGACCAGRAVLCIMWRNRVKI